MTKLAEWWEKASIPALKTESMSWLDKISTILLVICPLFQHYRCAGTNLSTVCMVVLFVYFGIRLLEKKSWRVLMVIPIALFSVYEVVNHGTDLTEISREMLLLGYFVAAASGAVNVRYYAKCAIPVALAASVLLAVQYICFYVFGFHLQLVPTALFTQQAQQWTLLAQTGLIDVTGRTMSFYRPSAFFLEPSHLAIYCFVPLVLLALSDGMNKQRFVLAAVITMGILLSTSGMGMALLVGIWGVFILRCFMGTGTPKQKLKNLASPRFLLLVGCCLLLMIGAYFFIPFFHSAVNRIFVGENGGTNAIMGRVGTGIQSLGMLKGKSFFFGDDNWREASNWNMQGFFYGFFTQGFIGMLLSYGFYVQSLFRAKGPYFWLTVLILMLSFFTAHTHAAFFMLYYVLIIMNGYGEASAEKRINNPFYGVYKKCADAIRSGFNKGIERK